MIVASRQLLHIEQEMRDRWFEFWQRGEDIFREAAKETDSERRRIIASKALLKDVEVSKSFFEKNESIDLEINF